MSAFVHCVCHISLILYIPSGLFAAAVITGLIDPAWTCYFGIGLATEDPAMFGMADGRLQGFGGVYMLFMGL